MRESLRAIGVIVAAAFRADRWRALAMFALTGLADLSGTLIALWLKLLVDGVAAGDRDRVLLAAIAVAASKALSDAAVWSSWKIRVVLQERTSLHIDERMVELTAGLVGIEHHERPEYVDRLQLLQDQRDYLALSIGALVNAVGLTVRLMSTAILLVALHPLLLLLPLFAIPSVWAAGRAATIVQAAMKDTIERERRANHLLALSVTPASAKEVRIFDLAPHLAAEHRRLWDEIDAVRTRAGLRSAALSALGWVLFFLGYVGAIAFMAYEAVEGRAALGDVVMAVTLAAVIRGHVSGAVTVTTALMSMLRVVAHYLFLIDYAAESRRTSTGAATVMPPAQLERGIELRGVTFRYPDTDDVVLRDVDLTLPAGATVAIVGENGAGKTTLVKLLMRFYEPTEGEIVVDGTPLAAFDVDQWRTRTSAGFQDFARFELEARRVVGVGDLPRLDDEHAVVAALDKAGGSELAESLPRGLATQLGRSFDDGVDVSGGQWQKLALGRAMMRDAPLLLVLDEPTASLDPQTEHALFERYAAAARRVAAANGGITVLVSHRFTTVQMADLIVVIDGGRVAQVGPHRTLVEQPGLYADLHRIQASAYR